ncbi:MAG: endonuclease III [Gemmatimonadetes bacterium]|nr:endonuclease III [Gemmatimonadota bacterium]
MCPQKSAAKRETKEEHRIGEILRGLDEEYADAECALHHENPFQLLVATILSAQCTDVRVNKVTPRLFRRYPTPREMAQTDEEELQEIIRSTGFFRNKAKNLVGAARRIVETFQGEIPETMEELLTLPGVARKTANVVLGTAFGISSGVVVDTHVKRLSYRLGLTHNKDPNKVEQDLMGLFPSERWTPLAHLLIFHGRQVCDARKPRCEACALSRLCPSSRV